MKLTIITFADGSSMGTSLSLDGLTKDVPTGFIRYMHGGRVHLVALDPKVITKIVEYEEAEAMSS